ncbi:unnamed protein product [Durusdinium trenchii]|uniref:Uncharacterized protein n=2 Tax=Durusdinium trenchii TaxID=1381693 RepID=A0ABP0JK54_9DINO
MGTVVRECKASSMFGQRQAPLRAQPVTDEMRQRVSTLRALGLEPPSARSLRSFALRSGGPLAPRQVELNALEGSRLRQSGQPKTQEPREGLPAPDMPPSSPSTG